VTGNNTLDTVVEKFPDRSTEITRLFCRSESFREVCEDYVLCINAIRKIFITDSLRYENLMDYKHAKEELEKELFYILDKAISIKSKRK